MFPLLTVLALFAGAAPANAQPLAGTCTIGRVIDGDTVECAEGERVRLLLIDAPEMDQGDFGLESKTLLETLLPIGVVTMVELDVTERDKYQRLLAYLYAPDGTMVNEAIVSAGYAVVSVYPPNVRHVENTILQSDVENWTSALSEMPVGRGSRKTMSPGTVRHHLNTLSNLYQRAIADQRVPAGCNPIATLLDKPTANEDEARWLEVHEAALLLEAARHYRSAREERTLPFTHALIATFLLTGGRETEVLGLEVDDVSFHRRTVTFRPNTWRELKTKKSHRPVPLWPQLEPILRDHMAERERSGGLGRLLFPSHRMQEECMLTDVRPTLDAVARRAGWVNGEIRTKIFRHTYCAARLQTLDRGAPVSPYTVSRELGHGGFSMVDRTYGHLGTIRHRSECVEYRVEAFAELLAVRLRALHAPRHEQCRATAAGGARCRERSGLNEDGFCAWHDPKRRAASRPK